MNLKVRCKNPIFWLTAIPAVIGYIYTLLNLCGYVPQISEDIVVELLINIVSGLTFIGVLVDPTTKGFGDSEQAKGYNEPR